MTQQPRSPLNHMQMQTTVKGNDPRYKPVMSRKGLFMALFLGVLFWVGVILVFRFLV